MKTVEQERKKLAAESEKREKERLEEERWKPRPLIR